MVTCTVCLEHEHGDVHRKGLLPSHAVWLELSDLLQRSSTARSTRLRRSRRSSA
jgi:hypothetical protein